MPSSPPSSKSLVLLALLALYLIWGSTYLAAKVALEAWPPFLLSAMRYLLAGALQYGALRLSGAAAPTRADWMRAAVVGLCLPLFGNGGTTFAQQYIPSGTAALLVATVPMFLVLLGWAAGLTPRPTGQVLLGLTLGLGGLGLLLSARSAAPVLLPGRPALGVAAVLLAAFMWSVGSLYSKKNPIGGSPFLGVGMQMLCGGGFLLVAGLVHGEAPSFHVSGIPVRAWGAFTVWLIRSVFGLHLATTGGGTRAGGHVRFRKPRGGGTTGLGVCRRNPECWNDRRCGADCGGRGAGRAGRTEDSGG